MGLVIVLLQQGEVLCHESHAVRTVISVDVGECVLGESEICLEEVRDVVRVVSAEDHVLGARAGACASGAVEDTEMGACGSCWAGGQECRYAIVRCVDGFGHEALEDLEFVALGYEGCCNL